MKLFGDFEAVRFPEENRLFVTKGSYLYYVYNYKYGSWKKHKNAGNDFITVSNYDDASREELESAMHGVFPKKETDFLRLCDPSDLYVSDMLDLLKEDYPQYMEDWEIYRAAHLFLLESTVAYKSFLKLREMFKVSLERCLKNTEVLCQVHGLSFDVIGRDIYKERIEIVDGHDSSSYFWIMPVRVIDFSDTDETDNVAEMKSNEISIEEGDVDLYLTPFLYKYFDGELEANKKRVDYSEINDEGCEEVSYIQGFEWYLTRNFFTFESVRRILGDIRETIEALTSGNENEYTIQLKERRNNSIHDWRYPDDPNRESTHQEKIIDFYRRFIYRMEYMITVGEEKGYNLISFMGP